MSSRLPGGALLPLSLIGVTTMMFGIEVCSAAGGESACAELPWETPSRKMPANVAGRAAHTRNFLLIDKTGLNLNSDTDEEFLPGQLISTWTNSM